LGIGDWGLGPIPNPQSPIPNPQSPIPIVELFNNKKKLIYLKINKYKQFLYKNYLLLLEIIKFYTNIVSDYNNNKYNIIKKIFCKYLII
jgi:hypothetical protein